MNAGATFIRLLHYAFIMFYVIAPFTQNSSLLLLHLMTGPLLWVHWYTLSDECSLTLIECWFRGIPYSQRQESFFFNVVNPIYKFKSDAEVRKFIWIASIILWLITLAKVLHNPSIVTEPFRQAWYGTNPPRVTRVDDVLVNSKPVVIGSHPREVFSYTLPQQRASSIIA